MINKSKKLIIHVGFPKTGSSALQSLFYHERKRLLQYNILYPETIQNINIPKHRWLIHALLNQNMSLLKALNDIPDDTKQIIVSEESISNEFYNIEELTF